jgi:catechol 2,3-dioxygenase-like lactoylglutathione lyase family enzyme
MAKPIPDGYPRVMPYLIVDGASAAIDFYCSVLGASERMRMAAPGDRVGHAELEIGDSLIMLADESPDMDARGPRTMGGTSVFLHVYVEREGAAPGGGPLLRRSLGPVRGPVRPPVGRGQPRRGCAARGDGPAGGGGHVRRLISRM